MSRANYLDRSQFQLGTEDNKPELVLSHSMPPSQAFQAPKIFDSPDCFRPTREDCKEICHSLVLSSNSTQCERKSSTFGSPQKPISGFSDIRATYIEMEDRIEDWLKLNNIKIGDPLIKLDEYTIRSAAEKRLQGSGRKSPLGRLKKTAFCSFDSPLASALAERRSKGSATSKNFINNVAKVQSFSDALIRDHNTNSLPTQATFTQFGKLS